MNTNSSPIKLRGVKSKSKSKYILQDLTQSYKIDNTHL